MVEAFQGRRFRQVLLSESKCENLKGVLGKGRHAVRKSTRARVLLLSDEGKTEAEIVSVLGGSTTTVERCSLLAGLHLEGPNIDSAFLPFCLSAFLPFCLSAFLPFCFARNAEICHYCIDSFV